MEPQSPPRSDAITAIQLEQVHDALQNLKQTESPEEKYNGEQNKKRKLSFDTETLKENQSHQEKSEPTSGMRTPFSSGQTSTDPNSESTSGSQTPYARLDRQKSVIQIGTKSRTKWSKVPHKGYKTTTQFFYQEIDSSWTAALVVVCYFTAGIIDSVAFATWAVFVNLQTGNTIFLALRVNGLPHSNAGTGWSKSMVSLGCYWIGALFFNCLHRLPAGLSKAGQPLHRWTFFTSFAVQTTSIVIAAILAECKIISTGPSRAGYFSSGSADQPLPIPINYLDLLPIGLMAFDAAGQVCLSRALSLNDLPTIVLSTVYHDLIGETLGVIRCWQEKKSYWDFLDKQKKQIRRVCAIAALFLGSYFGGLMVSRDDIGIAGALWLAAAAKIAVCVAWCFWRKKTVTEKVVTRGKSMATAGVHSAAHNAHNAAHNVHTAAHDMMPNNRADRRPSFANIFHNLTPHRSRIDKPSNPTTATDQPEHHSPPVDDTIAEHEESSS